jgi:multiple sugar transport system ATP-binding protein
MNLFPADVVEGGVKFGTAVAKVEKSVLGKSKRITVGVRPEDLKIDTKGDGLKVDVDVVEELGADGYLYGHTEIDGQRVDMVVRTDGRSHPNAGDKIVVTPVPQHVHTFDQESGERLGDKAIISSKVEAPAAK